MPDTEGLGLMLLISGDLLALLGLLLLLALSPSTGSFDKLRTPSGHRLALTLLLNLAFWMLRR